MPPLNFKTKISKEWVALSSKQLDRKHQSANLKLNFNSKCPVDLKSYRNQSTNPIKKESTIMALNLFLKKNNLPLLLSQKLEMHSPQA